MIIAWKGGRVYPDANGTLRLSVGEVKGFSPRDGIYMLPQTTLTGLLEKESGQEPFASPPRLLAAARAGILPPTPAGARLTRAGSSFPRARRVYARCASNVMQLRPYKLTSRFAPVPCLY